MDGVSSAAAVTPAATRTGKPYVGLRTYREDDREFFFGREEDEAVIFANAVASRLTVLYGASGVGKSSLLRAGVIPHVRLHSAAAAVYYSRWQRSDFEAALNGHCAAAMAALSPAPASPLPASAPLDEFLHRLTETADRPMFLLLDQFEEYLLYHSGEHTPFDLALARTVNRRDIDVRVLIGIREDALHRFDQRFRRRIANPLGNTLRLKHLTDVQAARAIVEPLRVFREKNPDAAAPAHVSDETVRGILREVRPRTPGESGEQQEDATSGEKPVETAYLQLVLGKLWDAEQRSGSRELRLSTLHEQLGGAGEIVHQHLLSVIAELSPQGRVMCERMFPHLVTPSLGKIAHETRDIHMFVGGGSAFTEVQVRDVLEQLSVPSERRILRRTFPPERFEIFHDVLAKPILDWVEEKRRAAAARRTRNVVAGLTAAVAVLLALSGTAIYFANRARAAQAETQRALDIAQASDRDAQSARRDAQGARDEAVRMSGEVKNVNGLLKEALERLEAGDRKGAAQLTARAQQVEAKAASRQVMTQDEVAELKKLRGDAGELESLRVTVSELNREVARLTMENQRLTRDRDNAVADAGRLQKEIEARRQAAQVASGNSERDSPVGRGRNVQAGQVQAAQPPSTEAIAKPERLTFVKEYGSVYTGRLNQLKEVPGLGTYVYVDVRQPNKAKDGTPSDARAIAAILVFKETPDKKTPDYKITSPIEKILDTVAKDFLNGSTSDERSDSVTRELRQEIETTVVAMQEVSATVVRDSSGGKVRDCTVTFHAGGDQFRLVLDDLDSSVLKGFLYRLSSK